MTDTKNNSMTDFLVIFFIGNHTVSRMLSEVVKKQNIPGFVEKLGLPEDFTIPFVQKEMNGITVYTLNKDCMKQYEVIPRKYSFDNYILKDGDCVMFKEKNKNTIVVAKLKKNEIKKNNNIFTSVYIAPIVILVIGVIAYFVVIPKIDGQMVSFVDWLISDPQNIMDMLEEPITIITDTHGDLRIRVFGYICLATFITSLFFVGRQLQKKPQPDATNALFVKKEPYLMVQDIMAELRKIKQRIHNKELDSFIYSVKCLEEKFSVESDFGYGEDTVIQCENNIAMQLLLLLEYVSKLKEENLVDSLKVLTEMVIDIESLLRRRIELKKK